MSQVFQKATGLNTTLQNNFWKFSTEIVKCRMRLICFRIVPTWLVRQRHSILRSQPFLIPRLMRPSYLAEVRESAIFVKFMQQFDK